MFLVPGISDVVRAYGNAISTSDEEFIESIGGNLKRNKTAVKIEITKVFPHCSTALNLAGLWREEKWPDKNALNIPAVNEMAEALAIHRLKLENNLKVNP